MSESSKEYWVEIPITGYVIVEVEAESEQEAIEKAFADPDITTDDIEEWNTHEHITQGNVCYALKHSVSAEEVQHD